MSGWIELGDGVFARRYEPWDVSVGVVIGDAGVLVVDTRATQEQGDELRDHVRRLDRRPPRWVVNTHDHFDHVAGNPSFRPPAAVWGHPSLTDPPDHGILDAATTIDLGDRVVRLRHLGLGHSSADLVVTVPDAGVVFAGDLVEESGPPAYGDDSFPLDWPATAARLLGLVRPTDRVVPGHGAVVDRPFVADQQRVLVQVARTIRHLWVGEVPLDAAVNAADWPMPADLLRDALARGYRQLDVSAERGTGG